MPEITRPHKMARTDPPSQVVDSLEKAEEKAHLEAVTPADIGQLAEGSVALVDEINAMLSSTTAEAPRDIPAGDRSRVAARIAQLTDREAAAALLKQRPDAVAGLTALKLPTAEGAQAAIWPEVRRAKELDDLTVPNFFPPDAAAVQDLSKDCSSLAAVCLTVTNPRSNPDHLVECIAGLPAACESIQLWFAQSFADESQKLSETWSSFFSQQLRTMPWPDKLWSLAIFDRTFEKLPIYNLGLPPVLERLRLESHGVKLDARDNALARELQALPQRFPPQLKRLELYCTHGVCAMDAAECKAFWQSLPASLTHLGVAASFFEKVSADEAKGLGSGLPQLQSLLLVEGPSTPANLVKLANLTHGIGPSLTFLHVEPIFDPQDEFLGANLPAVPFSSGLKTISFFFHFHNQRGLPNAEQHHGAMLEHFVRVIPNDIDDIGIKTCLPRSAAAPARAVAFANLVRAHLQPAPTKVVGSDDNLRLVRT